MDQPKVGALFAGYGGLELAVQTVFPGAHPAWVSEFDPAPSRILAQRFPGVPNLGDVTKVDWAAVEPVDIITGGSPCQDLSHAGKRAGMRAGTRSGLWASMCDAIDIIRPRLVIWENVRGALSAPADSGDLESCEFCMDGDGEPSLRALGRVLGDLAELGYDAAWTSLRAADVGAPHGRFRVFVLAWPADAHEVGLERSGKELEAWDAWTARMKAAHGNGNGHGRSLDVEAPRLHVEGAERLLPTPTTTQRGTDAKAETRADAGPNLHNAVALLPTPTRTDHKASGASYAATDTHHTGTTLTDAVVRGHGLMPTPSAADGLGGHERRGGKRGGELLLNGMAKAGHLDRFGQYAPAIARWEAVLGRPAPAPTEPTGKGGAHRLSPRFVEFLMGLPDGWVTDTDTTRNEQLKALGNGVVPQQAASALRHLLAVRAWAMATAA